MEKVDIAIIGAGVVGLAIARQMASSDKTVVVLERHETFGQETSSRNSEVIHAGMYYPADSLKAKLCVAGNPMVYDYCRQHRIPYERIGKLIVAADDSELTQIQKIYDQGQKNGVPDLKFIDAAEIKRLEPENHQQ